MISFIESYYVIYFIKALAGLCNLNYYFYEFRRSKHQEPTRMHAAINESRRIKRVVSGS